MTRTNAPVRALLFRAEWKEVELRLLLSNYFTLYSLLSTLSSSPFTHYNLSSHRDFSLDGRMTLVTLQNDIRHLEITNVMHLWVQVQGGQRERFAAEL